MIKKAIYNLYKEDFKKFYNQEQQKKITYKDLTLCYTDSNGTNYYEFPENISISFLRLGKMNDYISLMAQGLNTGELNQIYDSMDKTLTEGLKTGKNASKIGAWIEELRKRQKLIIHHELWANYLAVQWVREDEDPETFSNDIQMQKVEQLLKESSNGNIGFFFAATPLKGVISSLKISEAELMQLWNESLLKKEVLAETIELLSS